MLIEKSENNKKNLAKVLISSLLLVGVIYVCSSSSSHSPMVSLIEAEESEFKDYIFMFSKSYSQSEYQTRFNVFRDNMAFIRIQNSKPSTIVLGMTPFTDLTPAEFKSMYLSPKPIPKTLEEEPFEAKLTAPTQVDWRTKGVVTPIKDQGQCGSCWAFSATGAIESAWILAGHTMVTLSEQQLVDCSRKYGNVGCGGGFYRQAFSYVIANKGITSESNYPYTAKNGVCNTSKASQVSASISSKYDVPANNPTALQSAVAQQPTSVSVEADQAAWQNYRSGTITSGCGTNLDHDVLAVGYDTTGSTPFWIIKNSWGTSWGMSGYLQIAITTGNGVCGVNMTPGYPIV
jgi:cathepsin L